MKLSSQNIDMANPNCIAHVIEYFNSQIMSPVGALDSQPHVENRFSTIMHCHLAEVPTPTYFNILIIEKQRFTCLLSKASSNHDQPYFHLREEKYHHAVASL
jgi:hypothetical protein